MIIGAIVLITILLLLAKERISPFSIVSDVVMIMTVFCAFLIAGTLLTSGLLHISAWIHKGFLLKQSTKNSFSGWKLPAITQVTRQH